MWLEYNNYLNFTVSFHYKGCCKGVGVIVDREAVHGHPVQPNEIAVQINELTIQFNRDHHPTYKYPMEMGSFCQVLKDVCKWIFEFTISRCLTFLVGSALLSRACQTFSSAWEVFKAVVSKLTVGSQTKDVKERAEVFGKCYLLLKI